MYLYMHRYCTVMMLPELCVSPHWMSSSLQASLRANPNPWLWTMKWTCLENLVYHFFRQLWLVLGVKLTEINSNWFSRCINLTSKPYPANLPFVTFPTQFHWGVWPQFCTALGCKKLLGKKRPIPLMWSQGAAYHDISIHFFRFPKFITWRLCHFCRSVFSIYKVWASTS